MAIKLLDYLPYYKKENVRKYETVESANNLNPDQKVKDASPDLSLQCLHIKAPVQKLTEHDELVTSLVKRPVILAL